MKKIIICLIALFTISLLYKFYKKEEIIRKPIYKSPPEKYQLDKDPRYLACVVGANNVIQQSNEGNEKMIQVTCKQIERMKIEDLSDSCTMGAIGLLHFIDHKEFHKMKGSVATEWAAKQFCQSYEKMLKK